MKEYCIYVCKGRCSPYIVSSYNSIYEAKEALYNMLDYYKTRKKLFFVDNDFYNNIFSNYVSGDYYCIKEREVTEWIKYEEYKSNQKCNKIINFKNIY